MKVFLKKHYNLDVISIVKSSVGAGSGTYFVDCTSGKSDADNRGVYLRQAVFSTRLMKWFAKNIDRITERMSDGDF